MLRLGDKWIWDFWFAEDGGARHIFFLQADRSLGDPEQRHWNATIGHAVSCGRGDWTRLGDALAPDSREDLHPGATPVGEPDDSGTAWTGSIVRHDGLWHLFYTGTRRDEKMLRQRVMLAVSKDLNHWTRYRRRALVEVDRRWYEELDPEAWHDQAWRDPWVMRDPDDATLWHMFITARVSHGAADGRGVVARATSRDLMNWTVHEPVTTPGDYGEMEVPQVIEIGGRFHLIFSVQDIMLSSAHRARIGAGAATTGMRYLVADRIDGPYRRIGDGILHADRHGSLYSGKLIKDGDGRLAMVAFRRADREGRFLGDVSDPMPVEMRPDGRLRIPPAIAAPR